MRKYGAILLFLVLGCAPQYKAVRILQDPASIGKSESAIQESRWAVTRNGVLIPEYTINPDNTYPQSEEEAWRRFNERKESVETLIQKKYILPDNTQYGFGKTATGSVLMLAAPLWMPLQMISESTKKEEERKGAGELWNEYQDLAYGEPEIYQEPKLKDKYLGY
jgi:hypothetical protein